MQYKKIIFEIDFILVVSKYCRLIPYILWEYQIRDLAALYQISRCKIARTELMYGFNFKMFKSLWKIKARFHNLRGLYAFS